MTRYRFNCIEKKRILRFETRLRANSKDENSYNYLNDHALSNSQKYIEFANANRSIKLLIANLNIFDEIELITKKINLSVTKFKLKNTRDFEYKIFAIQRLDISKLIIYSLETHTTINK